jgi:hypothetical protein
MSSHESTSTGRVPAARQSRRAAQLAPGNVVLLDGLYARGRDDYIPRGAEFTVESTERYASDCIRADGTAGNGPERLCLHEDRTVPVRVTAIHVTAAAAYAVCRREELPLAMQPAFPRGADYVVTRPSGMPLMPGYVIAGEGGQFEAHLISGSPAGTAGTLDQAAALITAAAEAG